MDEKVHDIFHAHGGEFFRQGTWLDCDNEDGNRDVEFIVAGENIDAVTTALNAIGCSVCVDDVDDDVFADEAAE